MKVTVIVPVYNSQNHLRQCLDSIASQSLRDIEVICVDDGSTDSSLAILEEYAKRDERFHILTQAHSNAGIARNLALAKAQGDYVIFWDSDDFFEPEALKKMHDRAEQCHADVCVCGIRKYNEETGESVSSPTALIMSMIDGHEVFNRLTNEKYIFNFTVIKCINKLVRRQFMLENSLSFDTIRYGEDVMFTCGILSMAEKITWIKEDLVNYRDQQQTSQVGNVRYYIKDAVDSWRRCARFLKERKVFAQQSFENRMVLSLIHDLRNTRDREAFLSGHRYIKESSLEDLSLREREDGFYYSENVALIARHLLADEPEQFYDFLFYYHYSQTMQLRDKLRLSRADSRQKDERITALDGQLALRRQRITALKKRERKLKRVLSRERNSLAESEKKVRQLQKRLEESQRQLEKSDRQIKTIRNSLSYKLGRWLTWLPRKIRQLFRKH